MSESQFDIAVVMPVLNEADFIGKTLQQVYLQDYPMEKVEVVIADGGSEDNTRAIASSFKGRFGSIKILDNPKRRPSSGRNIGIKNTTAPYIIIIDGHCHLPSKTLFKLIAIINNTDAAIHQVLSLVSRRK